MPVDAEADCLHLDRSNLSHIESHRVPYFRYFGPTAIVPGFKQMVVSVWEHRRNTGPGSAAGSECYTNMYFPC